MSLALSEREDEIYYYMNDFDRIRERGAEEAQLIFLEWIQDSQIRVGDKVDPLFDWIAEPTRSITKCLPGQTGK